MLYLSAADVERCRLPMAEVIALVELALTEHGHGRTELPAKFGVHPQPGALLHAMPAWLPAAQAAGMKWVAAYPANKARGLDAVSGVIILNDPETGIPAAIMDAGWITAARTGASVAVAARKLAPTDSKVVAMIGPGVVGRASVAALREVMPCLRRVIAYAPRAEAVAQFAREIEQSLSLEVQPSASASAATRGADTVVTAAPWPARPFHNGVLTADDLAEISFCCALDFDASLSAAALRSAGRFFADDVATFEFHRQRGCFRAWPQAAELSHVVAGKLPGRKSAAERVICANLGLGIYDVAVARRIHEIASDAAIGVNLDA